MKEPVEKVGVMTVEFCHWREVMPDVSIRKILGYPFDELVDRRSNRNSRKVWGLLNVAPIQNAISIRRNEPIDWVSNDAECTP
jgi:hypothetical protein